MRFDINKTYVINLENLEGDLGTWFRLSANILGDLLSDGRILGRVLENALCDTFDNFKLNGDSSFDIDMEDVKLEVKSTLSNNGINFQPSNMIGAGRSYNYDLHKQKTEELDYYLAIDRKNLPIIEIYVIPAEIENVSMANRLGSMKGSFTANEWAKHKAKFQKEIVHIG